MRGAALLAVLALLGVLTAPARAMAEPLPDCTAAYDHQLPSWQCSARSSDANHLQVVVSLAGRTSTSPVYSRSTVKLLTSVSDSRAIYEGRAIGPPHWADIDRVGLDELLLPVSAGTGGTVWRVWHQADRDRILVDAGELFGKTITVSDEGYIVDVSPGNGYGGAGFHRFDEGRLHTYAKVEWNDRSGTFECALARLPDGTAHADLSVLNMDEVQARDHFCGEAGRLLGAAFTEPVGDSPAPSPPIPGR